MFKTEEIHLHHEKGVGNFGGKTIGFFAGMTLIVNNIFGPALPTLPTVFQQAGWFMYFDSSLLYSTLTICWM